MTQGSILLTLYNLLTVGMDSSGCSFLYSGPLSCPWLVATDLQRGFAVAMITCPTIHMHVHPTEKPSNCLTLHYKGQLSLGLYKFPQYIEDLLMESVSKNGRVVKFGTIQNGSDIGDAGTVTGAVTCMAIHNLQPSRISRTLRIGAWREIKNIAPFRHWYMHQCPNRPKAL